MKRQACITFLILLLLSQFSAAEGSYSAGDSIQGESRRLKFAGFPVLGYSPETRIAGGAYLQVLKTDASNNRYSMAGLFTGITQNRQFSLNLLPDLWLRSNRYHLKGELKLQRWPDKFYGLGNNTLLDEEEYYVSDISGIKIDFLKSIKTNYYAGLLFELENNHITEYDTVSYARLPTGTIPGSEYSTVSGLGAGFVWDSRDHSLLPSSGAYYQLRMVYFSELLGSTSSYLKSIIDLRKYFSAGRDSRIYLQAYAKFLIGQEIPFMNMSLMGGDKLMRGNFRGRYRDHHIILIQGEYHSPALWRLNGVVFGGIGEVFGPYSSVSFNSIKPSAGIGLRIRFLKEEKLNLRVDYGLGKEDHGFYVNLLEAF